MSALGFCHPDFQAVADEFARNFAERGEVGAAVCVTVAGETVVDLWGGVVAGGGAPWEADTRCVVFSCTKGATALCAHLLIDRGELDLHAPVVKYWPEFATHGKELATVAMMLDHAVGVPAVRATLEPGALYDWDLMCRLLAEEPPWWPPGTRNGYHLVTFGWTVGELVRRVSGRSLGRFFADEIAGPLGLEFHIGLPEALEPKVAPIIPWVPGPDDDTPFFRSVTSDPTGLQAAGVGNLKHAALDFNAPAYRAAELGAVGGVATARGLAGMYRPLSLGGAGLVRAETVARMNEVQVATHEDAMLLMPTRFSHGFMKSMDNRHLNWPNASVLLGRWAFGHVGAGGSVSFADTEAAMSFSYVMNRQGAGFMPNERGQALVDAAYRSLGYRTNAPGVWMR